MSSIGPQLPSHLAKRKTTNDVLHEPFPSSCKRQAISSYEGNVDSTQSPKNAAEVILSSDSDDNNGLPTAAKNTLQSRTMSSIKPVSSHIEPDSSKKSDPKSSPSPKSDNHSRIIGPTLPTNTLCASEPAADSCGESSSDSEDDYQPPLPPITGMPDQNPSYPQAPQSIPAPEHSHTLESRPQRDDWMLAPPTSADQSTHGDPTKLRNRKFKSGPATKVTANQSGVSTMWTETSEEKLRRLKDEVLGRCPANAATTGSKTTSAAQARRENRQTKATEDCIRTYNKQNRNRSLLAEREAAQGRGELIKEEADDPSQREFDREKDMALRGYLGQGKRQELLNRAADFGSRFQKGSYL